MELMVHDLLKLRSPGAIEAVDAPDWVFASLEDAPWVVVRRGSALQGRIPVGVRGATRAERFGTFLSVDAIAERLPPEDLRGRAPKRSHVAFEAMSLLRPAIDAAGLDWGPVGAAGFELATGRDTLTPDSDLDLVLRAEQPSKSTLIAIAETASHAPLRVDILVETPRGGVALTELLSGATEALLRTGEGPRLVARAEILAPC